WPSRWSTTSSTSPPIRLPLARRPARTRCTTSPPTCPCWDWTAPAPTPANCWIRRARRSPPRASRTRRRCWRSPRWSCTGTTENMATLLETINAPADLRQLQRPQLKQLADELRTYVLESVARTGGHLSSNLGTVELTIALHYVYNT